MTEQSTRNSEVASLLIRHRASLYGFIFSCVRNHTDAEDILQEVALAVTRSFDKLSDPSGFLAWSREIAHRQIQVHLRAQRRTTLVPPNLVDVMAESAERIQQGGNISRRMEALLECLESLSPPMRTIISKRYDGSVGGVKELANEIGRTLDATYGMLKRVRTAVRDCIQRKLAHEERAQ